MERSILAALIGGLLGISAFGGLALVGPGPGAPAAPSSRPEGEWRLLEPVTYENISIFPVVSSYNQDTSPFLTLEEGLATGEVLVREQGSEGLARSREDRKSTRLNSSHQIISYAVFCLKKKKKTDINERTKQKPKNTDKKNN